MAAILVIDDDDLVRHTVGVMLTTAGHTVAMAANGRLGVDKLKTERFDAVITDILMPEQEGLETIREIRHTDRRIGILVMSGGNRSNGVDFFSVAMVFGADAALPKPFTRQEMIASIDAVLAKQQARTA
jgi:DNA-binding response OmpR family regulator